MLSKILLVTILILLSWSSMKLSKSNDSLNDQLIGLMNNKKQINEQLQTNQKILLAQNKVLVKKSESESKLLKLNEDILLKVTKLEENLSNISDLKVSINNVKNTIEKHSKSFIENKKTIDDLKKSIAEILIAVKKHSSLSTIHNSGTKSNYLSNNLKPSKKKERDKKIVKGSPPSNSTSLNKLFFELYKTKELQNKEKMKEALIQLDKLKNLVWKSRKHENISKDLIMSILASIDITKNKWNNKENNFDLDNVEQKLNRLICKPGVCK